MNENRCIHLKDMVQMIPEALKRLLQPWLNQIDAEPLIEYIRLHNADGSGCVRTFDDTLADDMPTVSCLKQNEALNHLYSVLSKKGMALNLSRF